MRSLPDGIKTAVTFSYTNSENETATFVKIFNGSGDTIMLSDIFSELSVGNNEWYLANYAVFIDKEKEGTGYEYFDPPIFEAQQAADINGDRKITLKRDTFTEEVTLKVSTRMQKTIYITITNNGALGVSTWDALQSAIDMAPDNKPRTIIMTNDINNSDVEHNDRIMILTFAPAADPAVPLLLFA